MEAAGGSRLGKFIVTDRKFYKNAMLLIVPVLFQNLINQGVNMMDTIMVGRLGEVSISASSLANQYYAIYNIMCMGISAAGCSAVYTGEQFRKVTKALRLITFP